MAQEIDKATIESFLEKISRDKIFADSSRYNGLLHFVVKESLAGRHIKELNVAAQIYGEEFGEDKYDGRVRVYMFNLRKRLSSYYKGAGVEDEVIFVLEKGSYNMQFQRRDATADSVPSETIAARGVASWIYFVAGVLVALAVVAIVTLIKPREELYCWDEYVRGDSPTLCVLADQIVLQQKVGDAWINGATKNSVKTRTQFYNYMIQNPSDSLRLNSYTTYSKAIPYSLHRLTEWLMSYDRRFSLTPDSSFSYEDISGQNIIYLGQIKTMDALSSLFLKGSKRFSVDQKFIYVKREKSGRQRYRAKFDNNEMLTTEYAVVSYMPLEGSCRALFFASNHDVGTMATLSRFTDRAFLESFYESLPSADSYFNALFKVEGVGRTTITCELIELEVL